MDLETIFKRYPAKPLGVKRFYAVLIPVLTIGDERVILFESRAHGISQGGDTSFPGGRVEVGERFLEAALRETEEEIGLSSEHITIVGEMDYHVQGDRMIACYIGEVTGIEVSQLELNHDEVAYVFTVPISHLLTQKPEKYYLKTKSYVKEDFPFERIPGGRQYPLRGENTWDIPFYDVGEHLLWGLTAKLTERFIEIIRESGEYHE